MKRTLSVLFVSVAALLSLLGSASAEPDTSAAPVQHAAPASALVPAGTDASALALTCTSGNLCAWRTSDGSSGRCSWSNADNDWWNAPVTCSWSSGNPVRAVYNNGASTAYTGVCLYPSANHGGNSAYYVLRGQRVENWPNVVIRSHKWVTDGWCF